MEDGQTKGPLYEDLDIEDLRRAITRVPISLDVVWVELLNLQSPSLKLESFLPEPQTPLPRLNDPGAGRMGHGSG